MKTALLLAALALSFAFLPAAEAASPSTSAGGGGSRIICIPPGEPLTGPYMLVCGVIDHICDTTDRCR